ncbi:MAG: hypothetical protein AAF078_04895 [Planctomycetota bacterium]
MPHANAPHLTLVPAEPTSAERIARGIEGLTAGMRLLDDSLDRTHDMLNRCRDTFKTDATRPAA